MLNASAFLCVLPVLLLPMAGQGSLALSGAAAAAPAMLIPSIPDPRHVRVTSTARDPFEPDNIARTALPEATGGLDPRGLAPLPPNAGAAFMSGSQEATGGVSVRAIVTGANSPRALIDEDGSVRVVAPGDRVAGSAVLEIGSGGIRLANGVRLPLSEETP